MNYRYDGSFAGLLCCVFESYVKKEIPARILPPEEEQISLLPAREIGTDSERAARVLASVPKKMGPEALGFIRRAFLTCLPDRATLIFRFFRVGYREGPRVMRLLTDNTIGPLFRAVRNLENESHLLKGFLRFSDFDGTLIAEMEPKNTVLPLLARHFCARYPGERFLIFDRTHKMALIHQPGRTAVLPLESLTLPRPGEAERMYRALWKKYYAAAEVPGRHNEKCRMSNMPKRYWGCMTEFAPDSEANKKIASPPESSLPGREANGQQEPVNFLTYSRSSSSEQISEALPQTESCTFCGRPEK